MMAPLIKIKRPLQEEVEGVLLVFDGKSPPP
jgi:hypothetical protein